MQGELVDIFVAAGAAVNGLEDNGYPLACALAFGYSDAIDALLRGGARVDNVVTAAGLGRLDLVKSCFDAEGKLTTKMARYPDPFRRDFTPKQVIQEA